MNKKYHYGIHYKKKKCLLFSGFKETNTTYLYPNAPWVHNASTCLRHLYSGMWLAVVTTTTAPIGCEMKLWNRKSKKNLVNSSARKPLPYIFIVFSLANVTVGNWFYLVATERPTWGASFRKNPKESRPIKMILRQQQRLSKLRRQATRFPLATTPTRQHRSSTAGIREKRWDQKSKSEVIK